MPYRRILLVGSLLGLAFCGLGYRLVDLQVVQHDAWGEVADMNSERQARPKPRRGSILDAQGRPLALSETTRTIWADPTLISNARVGDRRGEVALAIAPFLQMDPSQLVQKLQLKPLSVGPGRTNYAQYVVLKRKVRLDDWAKVTNAMARLDFGMVEKTAKRETRAHYAAVKTRAIREEEDQVRLYPCQALASHVVGYVGGDGVTGQDGIEAEFNSQLAGIGGWLQTERDRRGRELVVYRERDLKPRNGYNVVLTIDSRVQSIVENELAEAVRKHTPVSVSAIIVRPQTGEILALATLPNFNPNSYSKFPMEALRNRVITDRAEPGSTFKTVVIAAALNEHLVELNTPFNCENGAWQVGYRTLRDDHPEGVLSVEEVMMRSSNIGAAKIGLKMGRTRLHQYVRDFGYGRKTGIPLPGEVGGTVASVDRWRPDTVLSVPMGYELAVTPLQMVMGVSAIANGGRLMSPMLVKRLEDEKGQLVLPYHPTAVRQVVSETAARQATEAMKRVVSKEGTGREAILDHHVAAGKTGTAKKVVDGKHSSQHHYSSFIGFFPADNPQVCISIVMDEPKNGYYAAQTTAPVFKRIAEQVAIQLNIPPDLPPAANGARTLATRLPAGTVDLAVTGEGGAR